MTFEICLHLWRIEVWYFLSFCSVSFEETCEYFPVLFVGFASPEDDHTEPNVRSQKRTLHKILFCWSGWWLPVNDAMRAVSRKYRSYLRWSVLFRGILSTSFRFFSEVTELNTFILKGLKLPGVHVHPFPLLFGNTQRGVQPKLGALRLAPLEILRAKLSNQAAIQQGPAPLPVNHRLSSSSGNRDTVWKIHWWMTREVFMLKWTEKRFLLSEKRVSEDLSSSGYVQATKSLRRCKESSCGKIIRVCWDERRKNNVQPTDSGFFPSLKTDGALLLLRLKPFFVSLLYVFCPFSTNLWWELETWQGIFSCPGLQDGEQRGDEPPVAGYCWVEMNSLTFHTRLWLPGIYVLFQYTVCRAFLCELSPTRVVMWRETDWLTLWGTSEMKMFPCRAHAECLMRTEMMWILCSGAVAHAPGGLSPAW